MKAKNTLRIAAGAAATMVALAGFGAPAFAAGSHATSSGVVRAASSKKVNLTFTTWVPNIDKAVDLWNQENPNIHVKVSIVAAGNGGTYQNFFNQLKAGNTPDIGQIEYDTLPAFRVQDGLANIASYSSVKKAKKQFASGVWQQVTFGAKNSVYGIPQDSAPMALYYRKDLFDKAGIPVPTTWAEFATDAEKIKALGGSITNFSKSDVNQFAGLVSQAGGQWFNSKGGSWKVQLTSAASKKVANYWQGLISKDLVSTLPSFTDQWNNAYATNQDWTWVSAVWGTNSITSATPALSGQWAVAPMPQWKAGASASAAWGGSSDVVFKSSKHPAEAAKFITWLNTAKEPLTLLNAQSNLYPASISGDKLASLSMPVPFFGNQKIYDVFASGAKNIKPFTWGPTMTQTYGDVADGFGSATSGQGTLASALASGQSKTVAALKAQSIPVK